MILSLGSIVVSYFDNQLKLNEWQRRLCCRSRVLSIKAELEQVISMNQLDVIILICVGFFIVKGLFRGFFDEVFGLLGLLVALILATKFTSDLAILVNKILHISGTMATLLGFILIFFGVVVAFQLVVHIFQKIFQYSMLSWLEKLAGGVVGLFKGATIVSLILIFLSLLPFRDSLLPGADESSFYKPARGFAPKVFNFLMEVIPDSKSFYGELKESFDNIKSSEIVKNKNPLSKTLQRYKQFQENPSKKDEQSR